ncbi:collagen alpha [Sesbania bispinosa]|nr:collagen alpha [Sesbania bispinosa]
MASPSDVNMQLEPPDGVPQPTEKASFTDTLMGIQDSSVSNAKVDLIVPQEQNLETDGLANKLDATKIASEPPTFGSQDSLHGDWLVVSRTKKSKNRIQGKGPPLFKDNQTSVGKSKGEEKVSKVGQGPSNPVPKTHQDSMDNTQMVFQSNALSSAMKNNPRKKRHRVEAPPKVSSSTGQETIQALAQDHGSTRDKAVVHPFGIQTSMNVDILAPNRMRFRDEDDPSSLDSSQLMVVSQGHDTPGEKVAQMASELSLAKKD